VRRWTLFDADLGQDVAKYVRQPIFLLVASSVTPRPAQSEQAFRLILAGIRGSLKVRELIETGRRR
jgi:hypothetical protein